MKIDRLIGIITILLQKDKVTAPELAERFEVSRRTINRDIEDICKAGIPIVSAQGYGGGFYIESSYKLDKTIFTKEQLQAMLSGLQGIDSVSMSPYAATVAERFSSKNNQIIADNTIIIDLASYYKDSLTEKIELIKNAISDKCIIEFDYYSSKGENRYNIEPYHIVFKWSSWYVFGYCLQKEEFRLFKLNRLWNLTKTDNIYIVKDIPPQTMNFGEFLSERNFALKAIFNESEKFRIIEGYGIDSFKVLDNGQILFELDFTNYDIMLRFILSFGDKVTVLSPKELIDDLRLQSENILKKY
ncbi:MAG: YafY family transcriptional regulator [Clostridiales bacterium]|nr:YafY family transcriptional regulator [Clostridiales bacterium]